MFRISARSNLAVLSLPILLGIVLCASCVNRSTGRSDPSGTKTAWICAELIYEDDMPRDMPGFTFEESANAGFLVPVGLDEEAISYEDIIKRGHFYRTDAELLWYLSRTVAPNEKVGVSGVQLGPSCEGVLQLRKTGLDNLAEEPLNPNRIMSGGKGWGACKLAGQASTTAGVLLPVLNWTGSISLGIRHCYFFRDEAAACQLLEVPPFKDKSIDGVIDVWRMEKTVEPNHHSLFAPFSVDEVVCFGDLEPDEE